MKILLLLIFSFSCFAQKPPKISQAQLDKIVFEWSTALKLQDWDVQAKFVRLEELQDGAWGQSRADSTVKMMTMWVLDPRDYKRAAEANGVAEKKGKAIAADIEDTVLHELIHLRLKELMNADLRDLKAVEELTVARLTSAMLSVKGK